MSVYRPRQPSRRVRHPSGPACAGEAVAIAGASALTAGQDRRGVTYLRCGGCGATAGYVQREPRYGRLVHGFFDRHGLCGNAVEISAAQHPAGKPGKPAPSGI
jgi:hypothetical protein